MSSESSTVPTVIEQATDVKLLELLVCPLTKMPLIYDREAQELISRTAGLAYPIRHGVPLMTEDAARRLDDADFQKLAKR
ncbi:MAG: Trm112 family protein [Hyphomicrobium sp.]